MSTLYYNGTILTMDDSCPQVEALLVRDGVILKAGPYGEVSALAEENTRRVDLRGKTLLPGFIDGHSHFAGLATSLSQCDLSEAGSFEEIAQRLRAFISDNQIPQGQWVSGTNYDHNFLAEHRHPDKFLLDRVSTVHPIVITHASSHMGVVNSTALAAQGLSNQPDPDGGHYGRVEGSRELNGYMEENAFVAFRNAMPMPGMAELLALFQKAQDIYASYGITTVQEGMVTAPLLQILKFAAEKKALYLDLVGYLDLETLEDGPDRNPEYVGQYQNHLRIGGYKIFLDGSPQGRTAWMKEPYQGSADRGYPIKTDRQLYNLIFSALRRRKQLLAHCNGDAAAEQFITQFEAVLKDHPGLDPCRPVMIHAQLVQPQQLARMANIPMPPSFFTAHCYYWGDIHIQNFGMDRAQNISPAASAKALGLPFTFHQDSPVLMPDVLQTLWCAARRITRSGVELSRRERISVADGLKAVTVHAARQYGEEDTKGTLAPGKLADLVILDRNPLAVGIDQLRDIRVLETVKAGNTVYLRKE
ncbi:MAG: amidohydrolase [Eubacteriales bacterium]|nr:amidohydrolase [Eubacteriales bacterium]